MILYLVDLDPLLVLREVVGLLTGHRAVLAAIAAAQVHDKAPLALGRLDGGALRAGRLPRRSRQAAEADLGGDSKGAGATGGLQQTSARYWHLALLPSLAGSAG